MKFASYIVDIGLSFPKILLYSTITIIGSMKEKKITHKIICDRIELGTYLIGGALIAKKLRLNNINPNLIKSIH